jgi:hypothetical protein
MTTPHQVDKMRDSWLDPGNEFGDADWCPLCEEEGREDPGTVEGDKWEWHCTHPDCGYGGDNFPEPDDYAYDYDY